MDAPASDQNDLTMMTAEIVSSYVVKNQIAIADLPALIQSVHQTLSTMGAPAAPPPVGEVTKATPAQIRKSITADALISFEDGKPYKTLKRHLSTHGLTPAEYKAKWGLPADYPTTAPGYSAHRSAMAKSLGLGRKGAGKADVTPTPKAGKAGKGE